MPKMPWTARPYRTDEELHVLTSQLPLVRYRDVPRFLRWTMHIRRQLTGDPTCEGFTLDARLLSRSLSDDRESMMNFIQSGEHAAMLRDMAGQVGGAAFVESAAAQGDLPLDSTTARERVPD